jgi:hypothetical protein
MIHKEVDSYHAELTAMTFFSLTVSEPKAGITWAEGSHHMNKCSIQ